MLMESMTQETRFRGLPLSPGVVVARVCLFNEKRHMSLPVRDITPQQVQGEGDRFRKALLLVREKLVVLAREVQERVGKAESEIFTVQKIILDDPAMIERVTDRIAEGGTLDCEETREMVEFFKGFADRPVSPCQGRGFFVPESGIARYAP